MTKDQRLRALVSGSNRHSISSDTLFAILSALESNFFYSGDGDEYSNDEVISAFKALAGELELPKTAIAIKSTEPAAWLAFATDGSYGRYVTCSEQSAYSTAIRYGWAVTALYASHPPIELSAMRSLLSLTDEERMRVFELFCTHCGRIQPEDGRKCQCWNDE